MNVSRVQPKQEVVETDTNSFQFVYQEVVYMKSSDVNTQEVALETSEVLSRFFYAVHRVLKMKITTCYSRSPGYLICSFTYCKPHPYV